MFVIFLFLELRTVLYRLQHRNICFIAFVQYIYSIKGWIRLISFSVY